MSVNLKNPFPGMNPWLEPHWQSVHARCLTYLSDQINEQLPEGLAALTEERIVIDDLTSDPRKEMRPDVLVTEPWDSAPAHAPSSSGQRKQRREALGLAEPMIAILDAPVERWIQIVDAAGSPVTVVELLSPANKDSESSRRAYWRKQLTYQEGGVNLVEIDLVREGKRVFCAGHPDFAEPQNFPYGVCVWQAGQNGQAEVYSIHVRQRLPRFAVPLRETDDEVALDLQTAVDLAFENGRYAYMMRYRCSPQPPLSREHLEWARGLLAEQGYEVG